MEEFFKKFLTHDLEISISMYKDDEGQIIFEIFDGDVSSNAGYAYILDDNFNIGEAVEEYISERLLGVEFDG